MNIRSRLRSLGKPQKTGIITLVAGLLASIAWVQLIGGAAEGPVRTSPAKGSVLAAVHPKTGVELPAALSHPKVVLARISHGWPTAATREKSGQGGDGSVCLDRSVSTPEALTKEAGRAPTDLIIVLDRSGSIAKWRVSTTQAVHSLLDRLRADDRVGFVTFDGTARLESRLAWAEAGNLARLHQIVNRLGPGASTIGYLTAEPTIAAKSERRQLVLLLQVQALGLGSTKTPLASLADLGMGDFSYTHYLESLEWILASELD